VAAVETTERVCPECHAAVPVLAGFPDWCDRCGWNVKPPQTGEPPGDRFTQLTRALGRRSGQQLARQLLKAKQLEPRWTPAKIAAYAIAAAVHLLTLALIVFGILAIVVPFPNVLGILIGATLLGTGLLMRPRLDKLTADDGYVLDPATTPELHRLAADVARTLDRKPPDLIVIVADFNAYWRVVGLKRRRVLTLGLPLFAVLDAPERVAIVGHELGHDRNGDIRRGLVVGSAVRGLAWLADLLRAPLLDDEADITERIAGAFMWLAARPVELLLWIEAHLMLRDIQRAEYLADALEARVAGSQASIALNESLLLGSTFQLAVQQASNDNATDVLDRLRAAVDAVPERERERRRRAARLEETRLDDTHPPPAMRIAMVEQRPAEPPRVVLNQAQNTRIDTELQPLAERIERELIDRYRGSLYRG
jgi:Zn-dependent protease with chaperone function